MASLRIWIKETRPRFLLLTPLCVFAGVAASLHGGFSLNFLHLILTLVGATCAHMSVNVLNDYFDFKSGIDLETIRTSFSGGSGIIPEGSLKPINVLLFGMACLSAVVLIGVYFLAEYGLTILPIGLAGVLLVLLYTPFLTKVNGISEPSAGSGFALIVLGAYFTQGGAYSTLSAMVALVIGLLVVNLLLLNEFPDIDADRIGGRKHLPIVLGTSRAAKVYCSIAILSYSLIIIGVATRVVPFLASLGFLTTPLASKTIRGVLANHGNREKLIPYLRTNVSIVFLTSFLISLGIAAHSIIEPTI